MHSWHDYTQLFCFEEQPTHFKKCLAWIWASSGICIVQFITCYCVLLKSLLLFHQLWHQQRGKLFQWPVVRFRFHLSLYSPLCMHDQEPTPTDCYSHFFSCTLLPFPSICFPHSAFGFALFWALEKTNSLASVRTEINFFPFIWHLPKYRYRRSQMTVV